MVIPYLESIKRFFGGWYVNAKTRDMVEVQIGDMGCTNDYCPVQVRTLQT
ncbi:hypothetical protein KFU94_09475 [Chloroflexi bacterium TSY]|nr:hypothetical protein [Chloroflexi bacterium TSY]